MVELLGLAEKELKRLREEVASLREELEQSKAMVRFLQDDDKEASQVVVVDRGEDLARSIFAFAECQSPGYFHPNWSPATRRLILQTLWEDVSGSVRRYGFGEPASPVGLG